VGAGFSRRQAKQKGQQDQHNEAEFGKSLHL